MITFIMGVTCAGKDTFAERACAAYPHIFGSIQVGQEFRRRYPPEFFKGLGAMKSTEAESWTIFDELYEKVKDRPAILVVGMPRLKGQIKEFLKRFELNDLQVIVLNASDETLKQRVAARFKDNPSGEALAIARLTNDKIQLFDVLIELLEHDLPVSIVSSDEHPNVDLLLSTLDESYE